MRASLDLFAMSFSLQAEQVAAADAAEVIFATALPLRFHHVYAAMPSPPIPMSSKTPLRGVIGFRRRRGFFFFQREMPRFTRFLVKPRPLVNFLYELRFAMIIS